MVVLLHTSFQNWNLNRISQLIHMYMFYTVTTTVTKVPEAQVDMQEHCLHMPFTGTAAAYKMFGHFLDSNSNEDLSHSCIEEAKEMEAWETRS